MGFHKRRISNELLKSNYLEGGIQSIKTIIGRADAYIAEQGLSCDFIDLVFTEKIKNENDRWAAIDKMISNYIYTKEMNVFNLSISRAEVYRILHNSGYLRDQKHMELKSYLSQFKDELDAHDIDYTWLASQFIKEYYATQRTDNQG